MEPSQSFEGAESYRKTSTYIQRFSFEKTLSKVEIKPGMKVLDLGCGPGNGTSTLFDLVGPNGKIVGIDPIAERIEIAKKNYSKENVEFHVAFGKDADNFGNDFDLVIANMVMHWLPNGEKELTMKSVWSCLKLGGCFSFSVPTTKERGINFANLFSSIPKHIYDRKGKQFTFMEPQETLETMLLQNGFGDVSTFFDYNEITLPSIDEYLVWIAATVHVLDYDLLLRALREIAATQDYVSTNKEQDNDWFRLESNKEGTRWWGKCWHMHNLLKYEFDIEFDVPITFPSTAPEIALPELDGKTAKMYRGGKICLTDHFKPLWARNVPKFGIAHAMALGLGPWLAVEIPDLIEKGLILHKDDK